MKYVEVCKALYDYQARTTEEIDIHEDDILYVIEKEDGDWWRVERRSSEGDCFVGLVPATYLTKCQPVGRVRAEYDYSAQHEEELTFQEGQEMLVLERDDPDWLLVKLKDSGVIGLAPSNYVEDIKDNEDLEEDNNFSQVQEEQHMAETESEPTTTRREKQSRERSNILAEDDVQSWTVHDYDAVKKKKKKSKGNLTVGNGLLRYGSETDTTTPVQQYPILDVTKFLFDGKNLHIEISGSRPAVLDLQASSKSEAKAILVKISDTRSLAQRAATHIKPTTHAPESTSISYGAGPKSRDAPEGHANPPATPPHPNQSSPQACEPRWATVLYTFAAESGDEVSVNENEQVLVLDYKREDGWWRVEKTDGRQGIVPSTYVQFSDEPASESVQKNEQRMKEDTQTEEERKQQEGRAAKTRELEETLRRQSEAAKRLSAPLQRTVTLPSHSSDRRAVNIARARSMADRKTQDLPMPDMSKVRTWTDRSGAFKVDAQFLSYFDGKFRLHKVNGVKIDVPIEKMSVADIQWVEQELGRSLANGPEVELMNMGSGSPKTPPMPPRPQSSALSSSVAKPSMQAKRVNPNWDWFDWFMMIGIPMESALVYASAFQADKLDDSDIPSLTHKRMKTLGLKEKHVQRIERYIETERPEPPSDDEIDDESKQATSTEQISADQDVVRKPRHELIGSDTAKPPPAASRPEASVSAPKEIHPDILEFIGTQFSSSTDERNSGSRSTPSNQPVGDLIGFDDDAWTPRDSSQEKSVQHSSHNPTQTPQQTVPAVQTRPAVISAAVTGVSGSPAAYQQPPPRQRPVSVLKHSADPTLRRWQEQEQAYPLQTVPVQKYDRGSINQNSNQTANIQLWSSSLQAAQATSSSASGKQIHSQTSILNNYPTTVSQTFGGEISQRQIPAQTGPAGTGQYAAQQQTVQSWQLQQLQPAMTGTQPVYSTHHLSTQQPQYATHQSNMGPYQQPMATGMVQSYAPSQPLTATLTGQQIPQSRYYTMQATYFNRASIAAQPTGLRTWQSATPENPFGSPIDTVGPLSPQRTGAASVQFSTPSANMFIQNPVQSQPYNHGTWPSNF